MKIHKGNCFDLLFWLEFWYKYWTNMSNFICWYIIINCRIIGLNTKTGTRGYIIVFNWWYDYLLSIHKLNWKLWEQLVYYIDCIYSQQYLCWSQLNVCRKRLIMSTLLCQLCNNIFFRLFLNPKITELVLLVRVKIYILPSQKYVFAFYSKIWMK